MGKIEKIWGMIPGALGCRELWVGVRVSQFPHLLIRLPWVHEDTASHHPSWLGSMGTGPTPHRGYRDPDRDKKVGENTRRQTLGMTLHICTSGGSSYMVSLWTTADWVDPQDAVWTHPSWNRGPGPLKDHVSTEAYRNHMFEKWKHWRGTEWPVMKPRESPESGTYSCVSLGPVQLCTLHLSHTLTLATSS